MDCNACNSTFETWDNRMLEQLSDGVRAHFPAILTWKYACDQSVVTLLRSEYLATVPLCYTISLRRSIERNG